MGPIFSVIKTTWSKIHIRCWGPIGGSRLGSLRLKTFTLIIKMETNRFPPSAPVWLHYLLCSWGFIYHLCREPSTLTSLWSGTNKIGAPVFHINSKFQWDKMELRKYMWNMWKPGVSSKLCWASTATQKKTDGTAQAASNTIWSDSNIV